MTPYQYHYPYFLDLPRLNLDLTPFNLQARIKEINENSKFLTIGKIDKYHEGSTYVSLIELLHDYFLMIHDHFLFIWNKENTGLRIQQYDLHSSDQLKTRKEEFVEIYHANPGLHAHPTELTYNRFVTFIRKDNLPRKEDWHESYVIVLLHQQKIHIIPFDSFNATGGDPLYQWPALASWDWENGKLHGYGMRMGSFTVDFHQPL